MMRSVLYLDVANWVGGVKCQNGYVLVHVKEGRVDPDVLV